jgi:O-6-methylguanine DNA methyltransferase
VVAKGGKPGSGRAIVSRTEIDSPIGPLGLYGTNEGLMAIVFPRHSRVAVEAWLDRVVGEARIVDDNAAHEGTIGQLEEYFAGTRREFDLELDLRGTAFQRRVWETVAAVPYGQTRSYAEVAQSVGNGKAVRAVGAANGANPIPLVIPCHRIIGSHGGLHGYGGGLDVKARLLELEGVIIAA